jgi:4-diphosphocytidyl-2-C-methyl-D-erythritol kinase
MTSITDPQAPFVTRAYAHAKLNLVLRILAREASGYHAIETLFQSLEIADAIDVELSDGERSLSCDGPAMPADGLGNDEDNLAMRAAAAYCNATRWDTGWRITIEKNIPVGGGLGGGSADAAAVLRAFEYLSPAPIGATALAELAATLGADVPFFISGSSLAWGWGRGDRLLPLPPLPPMDVTLVTFDRGVNTAAAYQAFAEHRDVARHGEFAKPMLYPSDAFGSWSSVVGLANNDFESVVPALHNGVARWLPVLRQAASRLVAQGTPAIGQLSGSGATCFVLAPTGTTLGFRESEGMRVLKTRTLATIHSF